MPDNPCEIAALSHDEQMAFGRGVAHTYSQVFDAFAQAFRAGHDVGTLHRQITAQWEFDRDTYIGPLVNHA